MRGQGEFRGSLRGVARRVLHPFTRRLDGRIRRAVRSESGALTLELRKLVAANHATAARLAAVERGLLQAASASSTQSADLAVALMRAGAEMKAVRALREEVMESIHEHEPATLAAHLLLGDDGRRNCRTISSADLESLCAQISNVTGEPDPTALVAQGYRTLVEVELRGIGRVAGTTPNILGKLVTTGLLAPRHAEVLEIGTLFGLFACALVRELDRRGGDCALTVVDLFVGTQFQSERASADDVSRSPVTQAVMVRNLELAGICADRVRVCCGMSQSKEVREQVADRRYDVIIVDGDHSEEGVEADLRWVEEIAAAGALVVVDDFGDRAWPGVTRALERRIEQSSALELIGVVSTSAFVRVT